MLNLLKCNARNANVKLTRSDQMYKTWFNILPCGEISAERASEMALS